MLSQPCLTCTKQQALHLATHDIESKHLAFVDTALPLPPAFVGSTEDTKLPRCRAYSAASAVTF